MKHDDRAYTYWCLGCESISMQIVGRAKDNMIRCSQCKTERKMVRGELWHRKKTEDFMKFMDKRGLRMKFYD